MLQPSTYIGIIDSSYDTVEQLVIPFSCSLARTRSFSPDSWNVSLLPTMEFDTPLSPCSRASSVLSDLSRSPSPPPIFYSTPPPPSQASTASSPPSSDMGEPPTKKQRTSQRLPRATEYVNLHFQAKCDTHESPQIEKLVNTIRNKKKIVVVAGAGISVSAGSRPPCIDFVQNACSLLTSS